MQISRRDVFKTLLAGAALGGFPQFAMSAGNYTQFTLPNGFRVHFFRTQSSVINASLILRSAQIFGDGGLGHIMEHTSFTGAAGPLLATEVKESHQDIFQESNAATEPGMIRWDGGFLPDNLGAALRLLALTSLEQKFDLETVASEARVVLQELYLDKFGAAARAEHDMTVALLGRDHPHARDTTDVEIKKARTPPDRLAAELRSYAEGLRLPANMDLFVAGDLDGAELNRLAHEHFGAYPFAKGPLLDVPSGAKTRAHKSLTAKSTEITAPMSQIKIAWNTGVRTGDRDAAVLTVLGDYIDRKLCIRLREEHGDSYTPEASYDPDAYSGIVTVSVDTSSSPVTVEKRVFEAFEEAKKGVDVKELKRFRDRAELKRRKNAQNNEACIDSMLQRVVEGVAQEDLLPAAVTAEDLMAAAQKYLPAYGGAYVRLVLIGQKDVGRVANSLRRE